MKILSKIKQLLPNSPKTYYLSIGENCLTDYILIKHRLKSSSTPYSHGRSNLDYAIMLEEDNYEKLLSSDLLYYDTINDTIVVRNRYYSKSDHIYNNLQENGFEFTHHDVINNNLHKNSYRRKISRMLTLKTNPANKVRFLYHHRINENSDLNKIVQKANKFLSYYHKHQIDAKFFIFTQSIVEKQEERALLKFHNGENVKCYVLKTMKAWEGDNYVAWVKKDNDLIKKMINEIR